ncbi:hypothetical protein AB0P19_06840 [Microbacterium oleivorans]|uniref:hypothetical protein n=1 Tax=Microbacterium oleivorans TaxID=273677 RepID=UPI0033E92518
MDDESTARLAYLMRLRKGAGVQRPDPEAPLALFRAADWKSLVELIRKCAERIESQGEREAVLNALGFGQKIVRTSETSLNDYGAVGAPVEGLLKDRRERYVEEHGMSLRTLMRREDAGLLELSHLVDEAVQWRNPLHIVYKMEEQLFALKSVVHDEVSPETLQALHDAMAAAERDISRARRE